MYKSKKRLLCFSSINKRPCKYGDNCIYAHSLMEQKIDYDKYCIYKLILSNNLDINKIPSVEKNNLYKQLIFATKLCNYCDINKCAGGFNCRDGVCYKFLKVCKSDLLTGDCINSEINMAIPDSILNKFSCKPSTILKGCINGHHLSSRGVVPYYQYIHINNKKTPIQFNVSEDNLLDSSTDEEINDWFGRRYYIDY